MAFGVDFVPLLARNQVAIAGALAVYRLTVDLLEPFTFGFLCLFVATGLLWREWRGRRRRLTWMTVFLALLALSCTNLVGHPAAGSLEWMYPPDSNWPERADAIVVLGSGLRAEEGVQGHVQLDAESMFRCLHAAEVYRRTGPCPVIVSGGKVYSSAPPAAEVMRDFLIKLGVAPSDIVAETSARTTYENAVNSHKILQQRGIRQAVLVTSATHMFRSVRCFRALGIDVTPSVCNCQAITFQWSPSTFLPSAAAARNVQAACHEWVGIAWYWLNGRI